MSQIYTDRKKTENTVHNKTAESQPSPDALSAGAFTPTQAQLGHRVDLPDAIRDKMENAFGADFSAVKLYESEAVGEAGAEAVAQGGSIAFAPGMLDFTSYGGQVRLGHELSHVVSQTRGEVRGGGFLNDPALEARAEREGALAAMGQQVTVPTGALSPVTAAPASGPMQCRNKKPKNPVAEGPASYGFSFNKFKKLKEGRGDKSASVARVDMNGGGYAALKMGTTVPLEKALYQFHSLAGKTYAKKYGGLWNYDAINVRGLTDKEKETMRKKKLVGQNTGQLYSMSTFDREVEDEINDVSVFDWAPGQSRVEHGSKESREPGAISENPKDTMEDLDYRRMMGYIAMTDLATGNFDRLIGQLNLGNWTEERDKKMVHLIDNDNTEAGGIGDDLKAGRDRQVWLLRAMRFLGKGARERNLGARFISYAKSEDSGNNSPEELQRIFGDSRLESRRPKKPGEKDLPRDIGQAGSIGALQAIAALPEMRDKLEAQFRQQSPNGELDKYQKELLERMQIVSEYSTDTRMSEIYEQLGAIGLQPFPGEKKEVTDLRASLLQEIQTRRAQRRQPQG